MWFLSLSVVGPTVALMSSLFMLNTRQAAISRRVWEAAVQVRNMHRAGVMWCGQRWSSKRHQWSGCSQTSFLPGCCRKMCVLLGTDDALSLKTCIRSGVDSAFFDRVSPRVGSGLWWRLMNFLRIRFLPVILVRLANLAKLLPTYLKNLVLFSLIIVVTWLKVYFEHVILSKLWNNVADHKNVKQS